MHGNMNVFFHISLLKINWILTKLYCVNEIKEDRWTVHVQRKEKWQVQSNHCIAPLSISARESQ